MEFDRYTLVILRRPSGAPQYPEEQLEAIQQRHLAFNADLQDRGIMLAAGPFEDQWDESYRGISIYRTDLEETRRLAATDPAVTAGRLRVDAVTWLVRKGQLGSVTPPFRTPAGGSASGLTQHTNKGDDGELAER